MAKSIKFKDNIYLDASSVVYGKQKLSDYLPKIIESGTNDNGTYIKFSNGFLIQYSSTSGGTPINPSSIITRVVNLPISFVNTYYTIIPAKSWNPVNWGSITETISSKTQNSFSIEVFNNSINEAGAIEYYWLAIGFWK